MVKCWNISHLSLIRHQIYRSYHLDQEMHENVYVYGSDGWYYRTWQSSMPLALKVRLSKWVLSLSFILLAQSVCFYYRWQSYPLDCSKVFVWLCAPHSHTVWRGCSRQVCRVCGGCGCGKIPGVCCVKNTRTQILDDFNYLLWLAAKHHEFLS